MRQTMIDIKIIEAAKALAQAEVKTDEKYATLSLDICKQELEPCYHTLKEYIAEARKI